MASAQKCVHQGCGKQYTDPDEVCKYHPGPPVFHEGQKGWTCCKPRVLTFEEFMSIPPCTEGKHSTTDLPPKVEKKKQDPAILAASTEGLGPALPRTPISMPTRERPATGSGPGTETTTAAAAPETASTPPPPPPPESDDDDPALAIPDGRLCRRRGCGVSYVKGASREGESCVYHPGVPIFHEGSKGYSCCKRRVLEFDQFLKIEGCQKKDRHLFVGSGKKAKAGGDGVDGGGEERLDTVRFDFYQSATSLTVSFFLKKIDKDKAVVAFSEQAIDLDLPTTDNPVKRYRKQVPLYGEIDPAKSTYKILGTKLEITLAKAAVSSWPVLRSDDRPTGVIFQVGRAGKVER
ncbi:cord and cs domain containing protein [Niveomyces insectorum RCEF 264]|uniref:Cord and cs domain containing protein n=1 Tax=Niveomyces insectorum RCEF 264 TaxID=1081102 RepID=A0A168ADA3_9HYPO|nr:cord and cs domain containing protein [Niveomyces insectorum RCEF 264]